MNCSLGQMICFFLHHHFSSSIKLFFNTEGRLARCGLSALGQCIKYLGYSVSFLGINLYLPSEPLFRVRMRDPGSRISMIIDSEVTGHFVLMVLLIFGLKWVTSDLRKLGLIDF